MKMLPLLLAWTVFLLGSAAAQSVAGRVIDEQTGSPIDGAMVSWPGGRRASSAVTANEGRFTIDGPGKAEDQVTLLVTAPGHAPREVPVDLPAEDLTIALAIGWRASVQVVDDDGKPVADVAVRARLPFAEPYSTLERHNWESRTDSSGKALFDDLFPEGPVVFEVSDDRWIPTRSGIALPNLPGAEDPRPGPEIVLTTGRTAELTVQDAFGAPLDDALVLVLPLVEPRLERGGPSQSEESRGSVRTGRVDSAGKVAFDKLPAEILTFEARARGFEPRMVAIDLRGAKTGARTVRLDRDPHPPDSSIAWTDSVRDATTMASSEAAPVMVAMAMDGERANDWIAEHHFRDPEVVRLSELFPCLISSAFGEGGLHAKDVEHGEEDGLCSRYGSIPCSAHRAVEAWARAEIVADLKSFQVPRHVFLGPDGRELEHRGWYLSERELKWLMLRALRSCDNDSAVWIALRRLQPLWRGLCGEDDSAERREATLVFVELVNSGDEYAMLLLREFGLEHMPAPVRLQILEGLLPPALHDPLRALKGFLHDPEPVVRLRAWQRLKPVAERFDLATAVAWIADERDESVMEAALRALRAEDNGTAIVVADAAKGERWRLVEMLLERVEASAIRGLDAVLDSDLGEGRNRLLRALAAHPEDESGMRRLLAHAAAPDAKAVPAIRALGRVPDGPGDRGTRILLDQVRSPSALVRQEAVAALGQAAGPEHSPALVAALEDASEPVRVEAALALWRQGDRRGGAVLADAIDDAELGGSAQEALSSGFSDSIPRDRDAWRRWLSGQSVIPGGN